MITGTIFVASSSARFNDGLPTDLIGLSSFFYLLTLYWLAWIDMALKGFLCSLIFKIRQLIKEKNEEPEDY
jgi:hypothetical protein